MHKFRGSSCFSHTSQTVDANHWLYLLSKLWSICCHQLPKRGRTKAQLLPRVVLIIDHNICIIGLMCFPSIFQKKFKRCYVLRFMWRCPSMQERNNIGSRFKQEASSFYILRNHFWVNRKADTIKRGWGSKMNWLLKCSKLATKTLSHFSHISTLSSSRFTNSVSPTFTYQTHRVWHQRETLAIPTKSVQPNPYRCYRVWVTNILLARYTKSEFPSLTIGAIEFGHLTFSTFSVAPSFICRSHTNCKVHTFVLIGTIEFLTSVSSSLPLCV